MDPAVLAFLVTGLVIMLRTIFAGLKGSFNFEQSLIERVTCKDEVDKEILQLLFEAGSRALLPKDLQMKLERPLFSPSFNIINYQ